MMIKARGNPQVMSSDTVFRPSLFDSFFAAGFECSSHRRRDGRRLDLIAGTGHDRKATQDYSLARMHGMRTVRDGLRWHLIDDGNHYDWSSFLPMLRAACAADVQVIWDLCHYGYPDHLQIWNAGFVESFARFAAAAARIVAAETDRIPFYCPVNEISYWAWAGGTVGRIGPGSQRRGSELKRQLVRSAIAAIEAIRAVDPRARFVHAEPLINVIARGNSYNEAQFEAWDMLTGRIMPELGGRSDYLDIAGVNFYPDNQWRAKNSTIPMGHHLYRPLRELLAGVYERYGRPIYLAETGAERSGRAAWLYYVGGEVRAALRQGMPIEGLCLYPILDYPGWEDGRLCEAGLFSQLDRAGYRATCPDLADELARQQALIDDMLQQPSLVAGTAA
jgi:hypothetical protein